MENTTDIPIVLVSENYDVENFPEPIFESPNFAKLIKKACTTVKKHGVSEGKVSFTMTIPPNKAEFLKAELRLMIKNVSKSVPIA